MSKLRHSDRNLVCVEWVPLPTTQRQELWSTDDGFYSTVSGFEGLERPAVVIAVDGFRAEIDRKDRIYTAISRAMDLAVIVGERSVLEKVLGEKHLRQMERRQT